jgi:hypothetical protein
VHSVTTKRDVTLVSWSWLGLAQEGRGLIGETKGKEVGTISKGKRGTLVAVRNEHGCRESEVAAQLDGGETC